MDRLDAMSTVLAVVEAGSLSAAARRLNTPLATVSRKVSELETHLRAKLFDRSSRKLVLTDAGTTYVAAAKRILADISEAERVAAGEYTAPTGELIVTAPVGLGRLYVIPLLTDFLRAYPDIDVRLVLADRVISLLEDQVDVALRIGVLPDSSMMATRVGATRRVVCASPTYLAARGTPRAPEDLAGHDCITYAGFVATDVWTFVRAGADVAVPVRSRLVVGSVEAACDAARAGIGITTAFSYHVEAALEAGTLTTVLDAFQPPALPISLVYTAGRFLPIKLRAFLDFSTPRLKARMASVIGSDAPR
ncbi:MAG TPA: LysR family transcriptional regulator [Candidatus Sulfotelmatobacter sp.]|nr:LysR family transcriptional regulator [Candidatus Sulfotelmatobacter sp.]